MANLQQLLFTIVPIIMGVIIVLGAMVFLTRNSGEETVDRVLVAKYEQYQTSATVHYGRYLSFDDVCTDIGLPDNVTCISDEDEYAIFERLIIGGFYCIDSTGFKGEVATISTQIRCRL
jgi:hypothetical protein